MSGDYNRTTGLLGDGSTKYLSTNRLHSADGQNDHSRFVGVSVAPSISVTRAYFGNGTLNGGGVTSSLTTDTVSFRPCIASGSVNYSTASTAPGLIGYSRNGSTSTTLESSGGSTTTSLASTTPVAETISIFARGTATTTARSDARIYFWLAGDAITTSVLRSRLSTYFAALT